jgi:hypothetical protein
VRFEVAAAWGMGVVLPLLEIARRRTSFHPIHAYVDDLIAGALLLVINARIASNTARNCESYLLSSASSLRARSRWVATISRMRTNARRISMFTWIARGLFSTLDNIATPCSVKA